MPLFVKQNVCVRSFSTSGCIQENDYEYEGGENDIAEVQSLTQQECAELAASTDGGLFWTYKAYQSRCFVKKTDGGKRYQQYAGLVSGNKACGVTGEDPFVTYFNFSSFQATVPQSLCQTRQITKRQRPVVSNNAIQESLQLREFMWDSDGLMSTSLNANVLAEIPGIS